MARKTTSGTKVDVQAVHGLSAADVLAVFRLTERLADAGPKSQTWREVLVRELPSMVDSAIGVSYLMKLNLDPLDASPRTLAYVDHGTNQFWKRYMAEGDLGLDPMTVPIMQHIGTDFTVTRQEWLDDRTWYESEFYSKVLTKADWDHAVYSHVVIDPPGVVDGLGIARKLGAPPFRPRDIALVRLLHQELARRWRRPAPLNVHELPARQRQVLDGLRAGRTRREIAEQMGIKESSVHTHEKMLYRRAGVCGRGELVALLSRTVRPHLMP